MHFLCMSRENINLKKRLTNPISSDGEALVVRVARKYNSEEAMHFLCMSCEILNMKKRLTYFMQSDGEL